jgi:hypothetical protein
MAQSRWSDRGSDAYNTIVSFARHFIADEHISGIGFAEHCRLRRPAQS